LLGTDGRDRDVAVPIRLATRRRRRQADGGHDMREMTMKMRLLHTEGLRQIEDRHIAQRWWTWQAARAARARRSLLICGRFLRLSTSRPAPARARSRRRRGGP